MKGKHFDKRPQFRKNFLVVIVNKNCETFTDDCFNISIVNPIIFT